MNQIVNDGKMLVAGGVGLGAGLLLPHLLVPMLVAGGLATVGYAAYKVLNPRPSRRY